MVFEVFVEEVSLDEDFEDSACEVGDEPREDEEEVAPGELDHVEVVV